MHYRIASYFTKYKKIIYNIFNFVLFRLTNYLVPLLTIPYIMQKVGAERFGILGFAQTIIIFLFIIVDYGIDISGVQIIAQNRHIKEKRDEHYCVIQCMRIFLMLLCFIFLNLLGVFWQEIRIHYLIYLFSFVLIPARILQSIWFYTGMEEFRYLNYINFTARILYLGGIFLFIRSIDDFYLVPAIEGVALLIGGSVSLLIILNKFEVSLFFPGFNAIAAGFRNGWHIFISNVSISLYRNANVLILGLIASKEVVGFYYAGEKLIKTLQTIFTPITQVFYPYISRKKVLDHHVALTIIKKMLYILGSITFILASGIIFTAGPIAYFLFKQESIPIANVIRIAGYAIFFSMINYILGIIFMLNYGMKRYFSISTIFVGCINIIICIPLCYQFKEQGAAFTYLISEVILVLFFSYFISSKRKEWKYADVKS
jgi:PST family polysaccharide transporter